MLKLVNVRTDVEPDLTENLHVLCWFGNKPLVACQLIGERYAHYCPCGEWHFHEPQRGPVFSPCGIFEFGYYLCLERIYLFNSGYFTPARMN